MKERIFTGWTWIRAAYFLIGSWVIVQSALEGEWIGIALGAWPAAMGLFGLACAGGNCATGTCEVDQEALNEKKIDSKHLNLDYRVKTDLDTNH